MPHPLHVHINKYMALPEDEFERVLPFFSERNYRKKQYILQEGDICRHENYILRGCCRAYETDQDGTEHILQFGLEDWWIGNLYSFLSETPSVYHIDCLEDCQVLQVTRADLENLYQAVPAMERFFRIIIQNAFISLQKRVLDNLSKSATEKYLDFLQRFPQIEKRVPDHQVASYLGIAPQSLSRIRSQLNQKP